MPKRVLEGNSQVERAKQRQRLGTLKDLTVQPATKARYNNAVDQFLTLMACFVNTLNISGHKALDGG